jgi:hypothetical protein
MAQDVNVTPAPAVGPGPGGSAFGSPAAPDADGAGPGWRRDVLRWTPLSTVVLCACATLLATGTPVADLALYALYVVYGVLVPGTLVFRVLRAAPHTLVEDLAYGAAVGLTLEVLAWGAFSTAGLQRLAILWPLAVIVPFTAMPGLRRHWRPRGYVAVPAAWAWSVAVLVCGALWYLYGAYLIENPILPTSASTGQFLDLAYQMSLAGNAKHSFPPTLPQVAGEPLHYHWFAFVHMAMTSLVGHLDLPVVAFRLMIPALTALMLVVTSVTGWRLTERKWAGPVAAVLFFAVGEFGFSYPDSMPFGSPEVVLMVWASFSMTYSQPLLIALVGSIGDIFRPGADAGSPPAAGAVPPFRGPGAFVLVGLLAFASSAAKASSLPVVLGGLGTAALASLVRRRRVPWPAVGIAGVVGACQLFSTAVVFRFQTYGLQIQPLINLSPNWASGRRSRATKALIAAGTGLAFLLHTQLRVFGLIPLLARRRCKLSDREWFLLGGTAAGVGLFLLLAGFNATYFLHAGLAFGVFLSAAGFVAVFERARMSRRAVWTLGAGAAGYVSVLTLVVWRWSAGVDARVARAVGGGHGPTSYGAILPVLTLALGLLGTVALGAAAWFAARGRVRGLRGRGRIVLLTAVLLAGAPTLPLDVLHASHVGWWGTFPMPAQKVEAARWIRAHSSPDDVVATNVHCLSPDDYANPDEACEIANSWWLSAYSERSVLVEGWDFAPRLQATGGKSFWDPALLALNDSAVYRPTAEILHELSSAHHVKYVVVDRKFRPESPTLARLARPVFDNGRVVVYRLAG